MPYTSRGLIFHIATFIAVFPACTRLAQNAREKVLALSNLIVHLCVYGDRGEVCLFLPLSIPVRNAGRGSDIRQKQSQSCVKTNTRSQFAKSWLL